MFICQNMKHLEVPLVFALRETMLQALRGVITAAGDKISPPVLKTVYNSLTSLLNHPEEGTRCGGGGCVGAILRWIPPEVLTSAFNEILRMQTIHPCLNSCPELKAADIILSYR